MFGIVLCGGQSLRMGSDKGLLLHQGQLWSQLAAHQLSALNLPLKFSVNPSQQETYAGYFGYGSLIIDNALLEIKGPLLGVLSAHLANPGEDLFILACDMLLMETGLLEKLIYSYKTDHKFDAYIFTKNSQHEPLCGIYKAEGLKKIIQLLQSNGLAKHSMKYVLSNLNVNEIVVEEQDYCCFENFNTDSELNDL